MQTTVMKEEFVDPVCGMTVDPARAAGTSEREGVRYYFCSPVCKQRFDAAGAGEPIPQASCCGGAAEATPVQLSAAPVPLTMTRKTSAVTAGEAHAPHTHHERAHHTHAVKRPEHTHAVSAEEAQEQSYRTMMRKFWFASAVGVPLLLLMFAEFVPAWGHALMPYHRTIGLVSAVLTLPVLAWSGRQFFESAWNGLRNHNTNMDTLVALGTGAAWAYSTVAVVAPSGRFR
jgi:Cu+-exporting ATPase